MPTNVPVSPVPTEPIAPPMAGARLRLAELRHRWGWFLTLGVALLALGVIAILNMLVATVASIYMVGLLMLIGAVIQIAHGLGVRSWRSFFWWMLGGVIYAVAGIAALINPLLASVVLTLLLAITLVASGITRILVGFQERHSANWGWVVASGVVTLLAGLVIAFGWPVNSLWVLGLFLAIDLIMQGSSLIAFSLALKRG